MVSSHTEPLRGLISDGSIVAFAGGNRTEYTAQRPVRHLADLLELAKSTIRPTQGPRRRGRRIRVGEALNVESITPSDYALMKSACNNIAQYIDPDAPRDGYTRVLERVGTTYMEWDVDAGVGRDHGAGGDWRTMLELAEQAARTRGSLKEVNAKVGAIRKLMDLAATHCWIPRSERHDNDYDFIPPEWQSIYTSFRAVLTGSGLPVKAVVKALFRACVDTGQSPADADWQRVIHLLEEQFQLKSTPYRARSEVRRAYRRLRAAGEIQGPEWDGRARQKALGLQAVTSSALKRVARLYGSDTAQVGLSDPTLQWKGFEELESLVEGAMTDAGERAPYGLRRMLVHFTVESALAVDHRVPSRTQYPREQYRAASGRTGEAWRTATVQTNLALITWYAGWLMEQKGVRFYDGDGQRGADLRELLQPAHLQAFRHAVLVQKVSTKESLLRLCKLLARIASPYMESTALSVSYCDEALADRVANVSAMLASSRGYADAEGRRQESWARTLTPTRQDRLSRLRRKAIRVQTAWTRNGEACEFGYEQAEVIRAELVRQIQVLHPEGLDLSDQLDAIKAGTWMPPREWARLVRDANYWQDQLFVPLRGATSTRLDQANRKSTSNCSRIWAEIDAVKLKANGDFNPNYALEADSPYNRTLYQLYIVQRGARQILRTDKNSVVRDIEAYYVPDCQTTTEERISTDGFADIVDRVVQACEPALLGNVSYRELRAAGALGTHFFRHMYGTIMVRKGLDSIAAFYLHHRDLRMLRDVYSADDASVFDAGAMLARMRLAA